MNDPGPPPITASRSLLPSRENTGLLFMNRILLKT
jgi:hypothetical protein